MAYSKGSTKFSLVSRFPLFLHPPPSIPYLFSPPSFPVTFLVSLLSLLFSVLLPYFHPLLLLFLFFTIIIIIIVLLHYFLLSHHRGDLKKHIADLS